MGTLLVCMQHTHTAVSPVLSLQELTTLHTHTHTGNVTCTKLVLIRFSLTRTNNLKAVVAGGRSVCESFAGFSVNASVKFVVSITAVCNNQGPVATRMDQIILRGVESEGKTAKKM